MYRFPPLLKAQIAGEAIEYVVAGDGPATVVLVNGSGGPIEGWHKVYDPISRFSRVFAYNRPGIGRSSQPVMPQTARHMVDSLRALLLSAGLRPPYVVVGHSLGGLIVNLFARLHPTEVSAAVLVEATSPADVVLLKKHESAVQRFLASIITKIAPPHPNAETQHVATSASQLELAPAFPAIPLSVVSGGKFAMAWATPEDVIRLRAQHQKELALLSPFGRHVIAAGSGHFPQFSEPELVVAEIERVANHATRATREDACA